MSFDYHRHVFHSPRFQSVVDEAIAFFNETPIHTLPLPGRFIGTGVYALYDVGRFDVYADIAKQNRETPTQPIYVGKAVPPGWRHREIAANRGSGSLLEVARACSKHTSSQQSRD